MIKMICHLSDIHIRKLPTRNNEYTEVFNKLFGSLKKEKPDRIVIVGDLIDSHLDMQGEQIVLVSDFLNGLAEITPVRITRGNHDINKKNLKRTDSIEAIIKAIDNPNIIYYNETGFFDDENITWAVWKHGDNKNNNPWERNRRYIKKKGQTYIDLFHDPTHGSKTSTGWEFNSNKYHKIGDFKGEFSFFGDIHQKQYLNNNKTKAFSGSVIAQNFGEGDDKFHGYLLWDIKNKKIKEISIPNNYSFKTIRINPFTDFDELDIEIENPTKYMKIRIVWNVLPQIKNKENQEKTVKYINDKFNPILITQKNEFIEKDEFNYVEEVSIDNIYDQSIQHNIFREYLEKIGTPKEIINKIIELDDEISSNIEIEEFTNILWSIVKFKGINFMSYKNIEINWDNMDGLWQIVGLNVAGKTTIMKLITYILYNNSLETESKMKFGDQRFINNTIDVNYCEGEMVLEVNGQYFGIRRRTEIILKKRDNEIKATPTTLVYYKLNTPDDEFNENNLVENLSEEDRKQTQKQIEKAIGSYDNFMRVVMTTSDTLNRILSNDKAEFIDSLLNDSGLDVFDLKLNEFKKYHKKIMELPRVSCNVEKSEASILLIKNNNNELLDEINFLEKKLLVELNQKIEVGVGYVETLIKKLYNIDENLYNLDIEQTNSEIKIHEDNIFELKKKKTRLLKSTEELKTSYDEKELNRLLDLKNNHKQKEYELKLQIKEMEQKSAEDKLSIQKLNGDIIRLKQNGKKKKDEIEILKKSKICPTCGQKLSEEHQVHLNAKIEDVKKEALEMGDKIYKKENLILDFLDSITYWTIEIGKATDSIERDSLEMDNTLYRIGELTNDKNDVEKVREIMVEIDAIPINVENHQLKVDNLTQLLNRYKENEDKIIENKKINKGIIKAKLKLDELMKERVDIIEKASLKQFTIKTNNKTINDTKLLIKSFDEQEKLDYILNTYKKCIHRDGIPTQLLKSYAIPKINNEIASLLTNINFMVWLDDEDLNLKLAYNNRTNKIINAISGSGKERTFASVVLKYGLNQINLKSKPTIFLLDEIMGKLTDNSIEEFIVILKAIKKRLNKIIIIEHNHFINPDYQIEVEKNDDNVSILNIT